MLQEPPDGGMSRRDLLKLIGMAAGSAAMYQAMTSLGYAAESGYNGPIKLEGDPKGASVLILGAGLAGLTAALELRKAGYKVQVLEYQQPAGGRNWSLHGGDTYTELGGATQKCEFDAGHTSIPAHGAFPITTTAAGLLQAAECAAGAVQSGQLQRVSPFHQGVRRQAAALFARSRPISRATFRTAGQGHAAGQARRGSSPRKTARSCSRRCAHGARWTRTMNTRRATTAPNSAAMRRIPAAASAPSRCPVRSSACSDILQSRLWSRPRLIRAL